MKHLYFLICCLVPMLAQAQTLKVQSGQVTYAHAADKTGDMTFTATTLTIEGKTYALTAVAADATDVIDQIVIDNTTVGDSTVAVNYNGTTATVGVSGDIAQYLTVSVSGANVSVVQSEALQSTVHYTLTGTSTNGSFCMDGDFKANFVLDNLTLTNPAGPAIDIEDGKAISITLTGTNTLSDGTGGTHNATLYIDGHPSFDGTGSLALSGLTKHALATDEHLVINGGTIDVKQAVGDGFHINERFNMKGGNVSIKAAGDGIDVGFRGVNKGTKDQYERNGFLELNGGTLSVTTTGTATKALKADSTIVVAGATVTAITSGAAVYDTTEKDFSSCAAVKTGGAFLMTGGTLTATSTGDGGKGINATGEVNISDGKAYITTTGDLMEYGTKDTKPQGIKSDLDIIVSGGEVYVCAGSYEGSATAFKAGDKYNFYINGGTLMGIARKKTDVASTSKQKSVNTSKQTITSGQTVSLNGVTYTIPAGYANSSANVLVSHAGL